MYNFSEVVLIHIYGKDQNRCFSSCFDMRVKWNMDAIISTPVTDKLSCSEASLGAYGKEQSNKQLCQEDILTIKAEGL